MDLNSARRASAMSMENDDVGPKQFANSEELVAHRIAKQAKLDAIKAANINLNKSHLRGVLRTAKNAGKRKRRGKGGKKTRGRRRR
jgi:hypothetical protein